MRAGSSRRREPLAAQPSASRGLLVGCGDGALRGVVGEESLGRLAPFDEDVLHAEASAEPAGGRRRSRANRPCPVECPRCNLRAPEASNSSTPAGVDAARLREVERPDLGQASEGRRPAGPRGALRAASADGGEARPPDPSRPRGRARRDPGVAREGVHEDRAVPRRVPVRDVAAPARREHVPGRDRATAARGSRSPTIVQAAPAGEVSDRDELRACLLELPEAQARVVVLKDALGYSFEEISAASGMPVGTAKCYAHRARNSLRARLEEHVA